LKIYSANLAHSIKLQAHAGECRQLRELDLNQTSDQGKAKENKKKDEGDQGEGVNFQHAKGVVHLIFARVAASSSKRQEKLTLRDIMVAEPATPKYLRWSEYPIQFFRIIKTSPKHV
jgi:hypothetical protein